MTRHHTTEDKLALLALAEKLKNVSAACKKMGFSRDSYYCIKKAHDHKGLESIRKKGDRPQDMKEGIPAEVEHMIINVSLENPLLGKQEICRILKTQGIKVSPSSVRNVLSRHDLATIQSKMLALVKDIKFGQKGFNQAQVRALEKIINKGTPLPDRGKKSKLDSINMEERLQFQSVISELSARFVNLHVDRVDEEIEKGQRRVCNALGLNRSIFMEFSMENQAFHTTHAWRDKGIPDVHPSDVGLEFAKAKRLLLSGETIFYSWPDYLPESLVNAVPFLKKIGVSWVVVFPLKVGENVIGAITWESHFIKKNWSDMIMERLRLISEVFANALSRKRTEESLRRSIVEIKQLKDKLQAEKLYLLDNVRLEHSHLRIIGQSDSIKKVLAQVEQVAGTSSTVLIQGETGTGKELVAHAIHNLSFRKTHPMMKVNCSALTATLIESELFGHEKGAYSGATIKRLGRFEVANGSTIFLDEIGDLPLELQAKLLRVLQEGQFERLGSSETLSVDVRIIAATNHDLSKAVTEKKFRKDLYFRLNVFPIIMPPLRERREDIPLLIKGFIEEFSKVIDRKIDTISRDTLKSIENYSWPGNVRELKNLVERGMIISRGKTLHIQLPETESVEKSTIMAMDDLQRKHIIETLGKTDGRIFGDKGAARLLGMNPSTLQSRIKRLGINRSNVFN